MGCLDHRQMFGPLDLEIIDRVYEAAAAHFEARYLYCEGPGDAEAETLRKAIFASGRLDFDTLCDKVLAQVAESGSDRRAA